MQLINCEVTLNLIWSGNCVSCEANRVTRLAITDEKLYVRGKNFLRILMVEQFPRLQHQHY